MRAVAFWALAAATAGLYLVMAASSLPQLDVGGELKPFDLRLWGYTLEQATAYLTCLSPEQVAFYRDVQHTLDLFFPVLWTLTLFFAIAALAPRATGGWKWVLAALALPLAFFDLQENFAVDRMLAAGADGLTADLVQEASGWTVLKFGMTGVVLMLLLVLLARWGLARLLAKPA
jgi:hypothetical protein